jgi:acetyl esterase/lipase
MAVSVAMSMNSDIDPLPGFCVHIDPKVDATATVTPVMPNTLPNLLYNKIK